MQFLKFLRNFYILVALICITTFIVLYFSEFILGMEICSLCVYERFPYLMILYFVLQICCGYFFIGDLLTKEVLFSFLKNIIKNNIYIIGLLFISIFISLNHIALEKGFIKASFLCSKHTNVDFSNSSASDYVKSAFESKIFPCDVSGIKILGFSFAELNLFFSVLLMVVFLLVNFLIYARCFSQESFYKSLHLNSDYYF